MSEDEIICVHVVKIGDSVGEIVGLKEVGISDGNDVGDSVGLLVGNIVGD
jgi:hypothetical protein